MYLHIIFYYINKKNVSLLEAKDSLVTTEDFREYFHSLAVATAVATAATGCCFGFGFDFFAVRLTVIFLTSLDEGEEVVVVVVFVEVVVLAELLAVATEAGLSTFVGNCLALINCFFSFHFFIVSFFSFLRCERSSRTC